MPPPSRSPGITNSVSPSLVATARDNYTTAIPHTGRYTLSSRHQADLISRPPQSSLQATPRTTESPSLTMSSSSGTSYGNPTGSMQVDIQAQQRYGSEGDAPPLEETTIIHQISSADGQPVRAEINARIDKGFFKADSDWTCYRRNYFSVACSYTLKPPFSGVSLYLDRGSGATETIRAFAVCISAVVDGAGGKPVELIQHTPKRDKGPQAPPEYTKLNPDPTGSLGLFPGASSAANSLLQGSQILGQQEYDASFPSSNQPQLHVANYERIQFKNATANNGKRRAAQQYYHLVIELAADIGITSGQEISWVKIATRISAPMVVRGRSPGHYQDDRRASSSSTGPGGAGGSGDNSGGSINSSSGGPSGSTRSIGSMSFSGGGSNPMLGSNNYQSRSSLNHSPSTSSYHSSSIPSSSSSGIGGGHDQSLEPLLPNEHGTAMDDYHGYYTSPLIDNPSSHCRPQLPSFNIPHYKDGQYTGSCMPYEGNGLRTYDREDMYSSPEDGKRCIKQEHGSGGPHLPGFSEQLSIGGVGGGRMDSLRRRYGKYQGTDMSRGYFPDLPAI
ncbi:MAG: hypothetical protein M1827_004004 [Pycnora praestabilis]|nr:MAG: hypothetical protein M1827_004004 [Pycnora praestabilis]